MLEQIIHTENKLSYTSFYSGTESPTFVPCCEQGAPLQGGEQ